MLKALLVTAMAATTLTACNSTALKKNDAYEFPIQVSAANPALIFPVSLHGVPGNSAEVGLSITAGAVAQNGASVISAQQMYSMVGNMSWTLGENMRRQANKGEFKLSGSAEELAESMGKLTNALKSAGVVKDKSFNFKHVIVLHVDSSGGIQVPGVRSVTAFGGIIDVETSEIVSYIEQDMILANDHQAILGQMPVEMGNIIDQLLGKKSA